MKNRMLEPSKTFNNHMYNGAVRKGVDETNMAEKASNLMEALTQMEECRKYLEGDSDAHQTSSDFSQIVRNEIYKS